MPETLTDEMAALIWADMPLPSTTNQVGEPNKTDTTTEPPKQDDPHTPPVPGKADKITRMFAEDQEDEEEEDEEEDVQTTTDTIAGKTTTATEPKKGGRKPTDLVSTVSKLIEEGELFGYEGAEVKTNDEAIELLKLNLKEREKQAIDIGFTEKAKTFSPQVQAILQYAEQGAQSATQLMQLMGAMKEMEDLYEYDTDTPEGQESVIRQYYKSKGFKEAHIEKQLSRIKDAGDENLKEEAEAFLPELTSENEKKIEMKMREQEQTRRRAEEASKIYLTTVRETLSKDRVGDVPVTRDDKAKIFEAVANPRYTSLSGAQTTQFVKTLEELQFGKEGKNYEHFLNIVRYTIDPKGFIESLKSSVTNDVNAQTIRTLRTTKTTTPNTVEPNTNTLQRKTIQRDFVNPYA